MVDFDNDADDVGTEDPTKPPQKNIELELANQANDAMSKGADAHATTQRLYQMISFLRSNKDISDQANSALNQGADAGALGGRISSMAQMANAPTEPEPEPQGPGLGQRLQNSVINAAAGLGNMAMHPWDTAKNMVTGAAKDAYTSLKASAEQDAENALANSTGQTGVVPRTVTPQQAGAAGANTLFNVAAPGMVGALKSTAARVLAPIVVSAIGGAMQNPQDRLAGAIQSGVVGGLMHGATAAGESLANAGDLQGRINAAPTTYESQSGLRATRNEVNAKNYGEAETEARQQGGTSPDVQAILQRPDVKAYADYAKLELTQHHNEGVMVEPNDYDIADQSYKDMSTRVGKLKSLIDAAKASPAERQEYLSLRSAQEDLKDAMDQLAPSYQSSAVPGANEQFKINRAAIQSGNTAASLMQGKKVPMQGAMRDVNPEKVMTENVPNYKGPQAQAATQAALGSAKQYLNPLTPNLVKGFGLPKQYMQLLRLSPLIEALDEQTGRSPGLSLPVDPRYLIPMLAAQATKQQP